MLISAGPTREAIDPVRFISNYSTGYMGRTLAEAALARGHRVTVVNGPSTEPLPKAAGVIPVVSAAEMERALRREARRAHVIFMAAAVADFRPVRPAIRKLARSARLTLRLAPTPDIIARLPRRTNQVIVGFSLEMDHVLQRAARKLREKRLDLLLAQQLERTEKAGAKLGPPFGRQPVRAWLLSRSGAVQALKGQRKSRIAQVLLDKAEALWYGDPRF